MSDIAVTVTDPLPVGVTVTSPLAVVVESAGVPGPPGRGVQVYEQAAEPTEALPGDIWIIP